MPFYNQHSLERELDSKADQWKVDGLNNRISNLEYKIRSLEETCDELVTVARNRHDSLCQLIDILIDTVDTIDVNMLIEVKQYI